jgi:divalent metal cation (Fe/Co/Zn/Cd) transporter
VESEVAVQRAAEEEAADPARTADLHRALVLSVASVVIGSVAAVAALALGLSSGTLSLVGFGLDAAIDSAASAALVWRFRIERRDPKRAEHVEQAAERIVGGVLVVAASALTIGAVRALVTRGEAQTSAAHIVLLVLSLVVLPPLAVAKRRVALRLGSVALKHDSLLTGAAALLALVALLATVLAASAGLWWADAVGTLIIAAVLAREGWASVGWSRSG